jgi:hypothetical protein
VPQEMARSIPVDLGQLDRPETKTETKEKRMTKIFMVAICVMFPAHPEWDKCTVLNYIKPFSDAEECKAYVARVPNGPQTSDRGVKHVCMSKVVPVLEIVQGQDDD